MTEECQCEVCKSMRLVKAFTLTQRLITEEFRKARIAEKNQLAGLRVLDLFQRAEFARDHPNWVICIACDHLDYCPGANKELYRCYACDCQERA